MAKFVYYGIKYPFTIQSIRNTFIDLNENAQSEAVSQMMHLIFTPKGERLRHPEFGTKLIQFIFNPNDDSTWAEVQDEIKETVNKYVPMCSIENVDVTEAEDGIGIDVTIRFHVSGSEKTYEVKTNI